MKLLSLIVRIVRVKFKSARLQSRMKKVQARIDRLDKQERYILRRIAALEAAERN